MRLAGIAAVLLWTAAIVAPAAADQGVRLDVGAVTVDAPVGPGETHALATIGVSNPGTVRTTYRMTVARRSNAGGRDIDPSWVVFAPVTFTLDPGATQAVTVTLMLPPDAAAADYAGLIEAGVVPDPAAGVGVAAGAGAKLTFTVRPASVLAGWIAQLEGWLAGASPWPQVLLALLALLLAVRLVMRRWNIRFERRA
jgi:hypothetical protein